MANVSVLALVSYPAIMKTKMLPSTAAGGIGGLLESASEGWPAWTKDSAGYVRTNAVGGVSPLSSTKKGRVVS